MEKKKYGHETTVIFQDKKPLSVKIKEWFNDQIKKVNLDEHRLLRKNVVEQKYIKFQTSMDISIDQMADEFEKCTLLLKMRDYYSRLKIVYYSFCKYGYTITININGWLCSNWIKYKTSIGHGNMALYINPFFGQKLFIN